MIIEILMRPSIFGKLVGAIVCAGLSIYNLVSSNDQVLIRSADTSSSRQEVRVFESPSRHLNMMSGVAFGFMFCGLVYFSFAEYNNVVEEMSNTEWDLQEEGHPQPQQGTQQVVPQQQSTHTVPLQQASVQQSQPIRAVEPPMFNNGRTHSHLRLVPPPITADGTAPSYLIPPNEFVADMESEDYWADNTTENKG